MSPRIWLTRGLGYRSEGHTLPTLPPYQSPLVAAKVGPAAFCVNVPLRSPNWMSAEGSRLTGKPGVCTTVKALDLNLAIPLTLTISLTVFMNMREFHVGSHAPLQIYFPDNREGDRNELQREAVYTIRIQ
jgi:hypothetical protein